MFGRLTRPAILPTERSALTAERYVPRLIAWELTKRCSLSCRHCRAGASRREYADELTTEEILRIFRGIARFAKPIMILTGGDPLERDDIIDLTAYGNQLGFRMVLASCGTYLTDGMIRALRKAGIERISLSLDGAAAETHDSFRRRAGSFDAVMTAAGRLRAAALPFQINSTITTHNIDTVDEMINLAEQIGAVAYHPFLLVPTGRGKEIDHLLLDAEAYEAALQRFFERIISGGIEIKPTCAPQFYRVLRERRLEIPARVRPRLERLFASRGCMGGRSFAFISNTGTVQICGFLPLPAGDLRDADYDFESIWSGSPLLTALRDDLGYLGKCGRCGYLSVCGGCRARAYALSGDPLADEPLCPYRPGMS